MEYILLDFILLLIAIYCVSIVIRGKIFIIGNVSFRVRWIVLFIFTGIVGFLLNEFNDMILILSCIEMKKEYTIYQNYLIGGTIFIILFVLHCFRRAKILKNEIETERKIMKGEL